MMEKPYPDLSARQAPAQADGMRVPCVKVAALFGRNSEIVLEHRGELYRLRITKNGKLILTK